MIKALQLVFYLVLYVHMKGCIWFYITKTNQRWLPPMFWQAPVEADVLSKEFFTAENYVQQYLVSMYYSILMLKPNEIAPSGDIEILVCCVILVLDLIVAAQVYGNVAVLVQMAGRRQAKFQKQIDNANTAMNDMGIPNKA